MKWVLAYVHYFINPENKSMELALLLAQFSSWENWGLERKSELPRATQRLRGRDGIYTESLTLKLVQLTLQDTDCKLCPSPPLCLISPSWLALLTCSALKEDSRPFSSMIQGEASYSKGILKGSESHPPIYMTPQSYLCKISDIPVFSSKFLVLTLFSSVQSLSHVQLFVIPCTAACQASLSITNSQSLLKLMSIQSVMPSNHLVLCRPFLLLFSIFPSIRNFSNESVLHIRWPKYWSFSFSISPSNEYSGLISFRMNWFDLLAVQGALKSLLQQHSSKASILRHSALFIVQLSHPYVTTGKTIALTRWTFVGKVMSLLLNMLSRFVKALSLTLSYTWKYLHICETQGARVSVLEAGK